MLERLATPNLSTGGLEWDSLSATSHSCLGLAVALGAMDCESSK